jgi:hypothetical protein
MGDNPNHKNFVYRPMNKIWCVIAVLTLLGHDMKAQADPVADLKKEIAFYSDVMVNARDEDHRLRAHDMLKKSMDALLQMPGSYGVSLDSIPWISVLAGPQYRIITWQWMQDPETYKYVGYIQTATALTELKDSRPFVNGSAFNTYTPATWYGALYYDIIPFERQGKPYALLLGFNAESPSMNTKVADILDLNGDAPVFGVPVFTGKEDQPMTRILLQYADVATVHIQYDSLLGGLVHDHLEVLQGVGLNGEALPVSDGSLEGWILTNGDWVYQTEVYDVPSATPPMTDERKERKEDKDIMGRPRKE